MPKQPEDKQPAQATEWLRSEESDVFTELARMTAAGEQGVLATVVKTGGSVPRRAGAKMIIHADGTLTGTVGGGAAEALIMAQSAETLESEECRQVAVDLAGEHGVCGGKMEIFLEPVLRTSPFVVIGAGHVGRAVVSVGRGLGFRFTLVDDRAEFLAQTADFPGVKTILAGPDELPKALNVQPREAVLVCSRSHDRDAGYLRSLLRIEQDAGRQFAFIGSLGSLRKAAQVRSAVAADPELAERLSEVRLPVGLDLGAETPAEIAVSIIAEVMAVLRGVPRSELAGGGFGYRLLGLRK